MLGTDIFPGFVRQEQAAVVESTSQFKALAIKPAQSNVPQPGVSTPYVQPVITQPPTTSITTSNSPFLLWTKLVVGIGLFACLIGGWSAMLAWFGFVFLLFCLSWAQGIKI